MLHAVSCRVLLRMLHADYGRVLLRMPHAASLTIRLCMLYP
jgi:hypothetical protein